MNMNMIDNNELQMLANLIDNILANDNDLRMKSEIIFVQFKEQNPDKFILLLLNIVKVSQNIGVRNFAIVMLRKNLSAFSEKNFNSLWSKLQPETQKTFKNEIFPIIQQEPNKLTRGMLADLIGEIAGTIINIADDQQIKKNQEAREWKNLMQNIFALYVNTTNPLKEAALKTLATLFTYANKDFSQYKSSLYSIFKTGMENTDYDVKLAAIESLGSFLEICESVDAKAFEDLLPLLLDSSFSLTKHDEQMGSDALGILADIAESEPKFYKKNFKSLFCCMAKILALKIKEQDGIKQLAIEIIILVLEKLPAIVRSNDQAIKEVLEMIFNYMIDINSTVEPEWEKPIEGFNEELEDDSESAIIKYSIHAIDRLIASIGEKKVIPNLSSIIYTMLENSNDWRYKHAALMGLSQVGEYVDELNEIEPIIKHVIVYYQDPHPKIRYAALHCTGQICDDMKPDFQTRYHELVVPNLLKACEDTVLRVVSHAFAALSNFFEGAKPEVSLKYCDNLLKIAFDWVRNGISLVKENAISTISAIAESIKTGYIPYFDESIQILYSILSTHVSKEYKQLRGEAIECLTIIASSVGYKYFSKYADQIIQVFIQIQENHLDEIDPQKSYLLSGWQKLCMIMQDAMIPYLQRLLPSLFKVAGSILKTPQKSLDTTEARSLVTALNDKPKDKKDEKKTEINTYETEEAEIAILMLSVFINELKEGFLPYVNAVIELIIPMCNYNQSEKIRECSAKCLPGILRLINNTSMPTNRVLQTDMCNMFTNTLWNSLLTEYDTDVIITQVECITECIEIMGKYMSDKQLEDICQKILSCLKESDDRANDHEKVISESDAQDEDEDNDEIELLEDDIAKEEELHNAIVKLIGVIFKTHKELSLPLAHVIYNQVLSQALQADLTDAQHKFGLLLINTIIENLGIELIPSIWSNLSEALISFCVDDSPLVREQAVYGISLLAEKSKEIFALMMDISIQKITEAINIKQESHIPNKLHGICKDNAIATLGKIIKHHVDKIPNIQRLVSYWINCLPLKHDHEKAKLQHQFLIEIILYGNPEIWTGLNYENLPHIIKIIADIWDTENISSETSKLVSTALKLLFEDVKTRTIIENTVMTMSNEQKKAIHSAITSN